MEMDVFGRMYCSTSAQVVQAVQPMSCACTQEMKNGVGGAYTIMLCVGEGL